MRVVSYNLPAGINAALKSAFGDFTPRRQKLGPATADAEAEIAVITITSGASAAALSKMPRLRAIVTASAGTDHIDSAECSRRGIAVRNCPSYSSNAVAELAIALAFAGLRDMGRMLGFGKALAYPPTCFHHIGSELSGKKCSVLGTGAIGTLIAKKLLALGCAVSAFSRSESPELVSMGVRYLPLDEALRGADIVFIALPSTPQTRHILDERALSHLRDGAGLVNIARGELVDSAALLKRIGRLSFVATDVVEGEAALWVGRPMKVRAVEELVGKGNFHLVPHIGASTSEAQARLAAETVAAVRSFAD
ncbi:MAG: 2-hydroxyacid dehydrogenase [Candidatus Micrarchaeota archaeon]